VTHRLNKALCDAVARSFYSSSAGGALQPSPSAAAQRLPDRLASSSSDLTFQQVLDPDEPLIWLQVPVQNTSQHNRAEAQLAATLVAHCINSGLPTERVAIVTPFRRQVMLIRGLLEDLLPPGMAQPIVDTVERVQGLTVDVIVASLAATDPDYVVSVAGFLFSPNRLNVTISRARSKAILISSPNIFSVLPADLSAVQSRMQCQALLSRALAVFAALPGEVTAHVSGTP
jgi:DNA replication ATP-dependent helicase Dna2